MTAGNIIIKSTSALLIASILMPVLLFRPKEARAQYTDIPHTAVSTVNGVFQSITSSSSVAGTGVLIKNAAIEIGKQLLKVAAKRILAEMTLATVNWINSGFHGSPLFIENPESFFKDIAKSQVKLLVDMIGYDTFRFPFGKDTALNVIASYKSQLATNAEYTLSRVINDPDLLVQYRNDFNYGGWNGFLINTQYPQNNYLGFQGIIHQNLASRLQGTLQAPAEKVQNLLQQGMGFLSPQICEDNPNYNNGINEFRKPTYKSPKFPLPGTENEPGYRQSLLWEEADKKARTAFNDPKGPNVCPGGLTTTTPGSVAANRIMTAINTDYRQSELAAALGNSLSAIFDALISHFLEKGLNSLASTVKSGSSTDDWEYYGNTLGGGYVGGTAGTTVSAPFDLQSSVSVIAGQTVKVPISGGVSPYLIQQSAESKTVAQASIDLSGSSGNKLAVKGLKTGTTSIQVRDTSTTVRSCPGQTSAPCIVTVNITVSPVGSLVVNPSIIPTPPATIGVDEPVIATISGGTGEYFIESNTNKKVATALIAANQLIISGLAAGNTSIVVRDSSGVAAEPIQVTITSPEDSVIAPNSAYIGQTIIIPISTGEPAVLGPFTIVSQTDTTRSEVRIVPADAAFLTVTAKKDVHKPGTNMVTIEDTKNNVFRVVIETLAPRGSCRWISGRYDGHDQRSYTPNMTEEDCVKNHSNERGTATWSQTTPKP